MSDLVGNHEDLFATVMAQIVLLIGLSHIKSGFILNMIIIHCKDKVQNYKREH